jgi:hypothetical protein
MGYIKEEQIEQVVRHLQFENNFVQSSFFPDEEDKINWDWLDQKDEVQDTPEADLWTLSLQLLS